MTQPGYVRIIGGKWRGRRLPVASLADLRPTPDRVRETLFNWLSPYLSGASCLDLFAGSGVLGFEALSRGAIKVVLVEKSPDLLILLETAKQQFQATALEIIAASFPCPIKSNQAFNIVFIDPPYQSSLLTLSCDYLERAGLLASPAYIYLESNHALGHNELPLNWQIIKAKRAGLVYYHLAYRE